MNFEKNPGLQKELLDKISFIYYYEKCKSCLAITVKIY